MTLLGDAAVAMWWKVEREHLTEFQEWHSKEHLPERMSIPGFQRGSRWQREDGDAFFYELAAYEMLTSQAYLTRLNDPTPWSTKMMPLHRDMVRSQCRVVASNGGGVATYMVTVRLSPGAGRSEQLDRHLREMVADLPLQPGVTGCHLLRTETPAAELTKEQRIRGGDAVADWILLISGHDAEGLRAIGAGAAGPETLRASGAESSECGEPFRLVHVMTSQDV
jgi:hypothetical protein